MKINYLEEKKTNDTANFATDTGATAKTTSPKPKYRFVMGEKKRKAEASGQKFTDTWTPPKQTEDYYPEPVSLETFNALNPDGGNSNSLYSLKKAQREGARIRNSLKNALSQTNTGNYSADVFDDIDDDTIEKNIPLADESLKLNQNGILTKDISKKYPYYRDGMAMMYAADEKGNKTAAKAARFAAYTEVAEKLSDKIETQPKAVSFPTKAKSSFNDALHEYQKKFGLKNDKWSFDKFSENPDKTTLNSNIDKVNMPVKYSFNNLNETSTKDGKTALNNGFKTFFGNQENDCIYYYHSGQGNNGEDIRNGKLSKEQLREKKWITWADFVHPKMLEFNFRQLASITSLGKLDAVLDDMITHFMSGSGDDYSNYDLTNAVSEHKVTQQYMNDFANEFNRLLQEYDGDINSRGFKQSLQKSIPKLDKYSYNESDVFTGLMIAIHVWTESEVSVNEFDLKKDGTYTGTLHFTFKDNFGLDEKDLNKYGFIAGFRSWYILQHYDKFNSKYKPFKTIVSIDFPISGRIGEKHEKAS